MDSISNCYHREIYNVNKYILFLQIFTDCLLKLHQRIRGQRVQCKHGHKNGYFYPSHCWRVRSSLYYPILYVTFSRPSLQDGRDDGCNIHLSSRGCQNSTSVLQFRVRVLALGAVWDQGGHQIGSGRLQRFHPELRLHSRNRCQRSNADHGSSCKHAL